MFYLTRFILCIAFALLPRMAQGSYFFAAASAGGFTYLIQQDFEGTGYDHGETWTASGSPDPDYATALEGSQSLRINSSASSVTTYKTFTNNATTTTCLMLNYTAFSVNVTILQGSTAAGSNAWKLNNGTTTGKLRLVHGTTSAANSTITLSTGTLYYIWIEYEKGTGADGKMRLYVSTTTTKPSADTTMTNGNGTNDHGLLLVGHTGAVTHEFVTDHLRVVGSATTVTTWPP